MNNRKTKDVSYLIKQAV